MPNLKSSKKDTRRTARRNARNRADLTRIGTALKKVRSAPDRQAAELALRELGGLLDRAAHKKLVHWRNAARQKSRAASSVTEKFGAAAGS